MRDFKLGPSEAKTEIDKIILGFRTPFRFSDLFIRCQKQGFENRKFILEVLEDIIDDGLVTEQEFKAKQLFDYGLKYKFTKKEKKEGVVWAYISIFAKK